MRFSGLCFFVRFKNRFRRPSPGGWADCVVNHRNLGMEPVWVVQPGVVGLLPHIFFSVQGDDDDVMMT